MKMINLRDSATIGGIKVISLEGSGGGSTIVPVTEWSSVPSNENVPAEKLVKDSIDAVVDYVDSIVGNIETLLAAI